MILLIQNQTAHLPVFRLIRSFIHINKCEKQCKKVNSSGMDKNTLGGFL
jgi:hypothetical protein